MAEVVIDELIRSASLRRQGFGGLFHIINHAAGLVELSRCGYSALARKGWPAHRHHVRLWRSLPDVAEELGALEPAEHDPRNARVLERPRALALVRPADAPRQDVVRLLHAAATD